MSDTNPWWEGRRNRDMKGTKVRVVFKSGTEAIGVLKANGDLAKDDLHDITVSDSMGLPMFHPALFVASIEPLDDVSDYFRIEDITEMRAGDVFVSVGGGRYEVRDIDDDDDDMRCRVEIDPSIVIWVQNVLFAYGLRKMQGPSHAGIWRNENGDIVVIAENGDGRYIRRDGRWDAGDRLVTPRELAVLGSWTECDPAGGVANTSTLHEKCAEAIIEDAANPFGWLSDAYTSDGNSDVDLSEGVVVGGCDIDIDAIVDVVLKAVKGESKWGL